MLFMPYGKHAALPDATSRHFASDQCSQQLWVCLSRMCTMLARRLPLILCSRTETSLASCQLSEWKHYTGMTTSRPRMYLGVWLCRVMCPEDLIHLIAILADRLYVDIWRMPTSQVRTPCCSAP